jgi:hypothetical protein
MDIPNGNLNISRFIKLSKIKSFPYTFIQIINTDKNQRYISFKKEPHLHYYKLNHILKRENIEMSLNYINLQELKENQLQKICKILGVTEKELLNADYFISNKQGDFSCYSDKDQIRNFDCIKNFLIGIQTVSNLKELNETINNLTEETITILTDEANTKSISNAILKKIFIENANKLNINTFNFIQANFKSNKFKIAEDEIIVFLNTKIYEVNKNSVNKSKIKLTASCDLEVEITYQKYFPIIEKLYEFEKTLIQEDKEKFENSEDNEIILFKEEMNNKQVDYKLENDYLIAMRIKFCKKTENDLSANIEFFAQYLKNLIKIDNYAKNNYFSVQNPNEKSNLDFVNSFKRKTYTDNIDIAVFNKLNYFVNRDKILIFYLNPNNLISESNKDYENIRNNLYELIDKLKIEYPEIKFISTSNPNIFNLFNLLPSEKENISIRFLDYSKYAYFNKNSNNNNDYYLINLIKNSDLNEAIADKDRNSIFNLKTNFSEFAENLNYDNLKAFINESLNLDTNKKSKIKPYLECADTSFNYFDQFNKHIKNLNAKNFKSEISNGKSFQSLVLLYNKDCNGCQKIESLLNDLLEESKTEKQINLINFYRYNTMNENINFKKYRNVPAAILFENGRIIKEIDLKKVIEESENHDAAIKEVFETIINKN